mmetsp:Transcript_76162/g.184196  ORF Transcript_76162/g.184196 Transcript_76162/m.184196 type:complete len:211 (+) Transcript_76162:778-1410(+)
MHVLLGHSMGAHCLVDGLLVKATYDAHRLGVTSAALLHNPVPSPVVTCNFLPLPRLPCDMQIERHQMTPLAPGANTSLLYRPNVLRQQALLPRRLEVSAVVHQPQGPGRQGEWRQDPRRQTVVREEDVPGIVIHGTFEPGVSKLRANQFAPVLHLWQVAIRQRPPAQRQVRRLALQRVISMWLRVYCPCSRSGQMTTCGQVHTGPDAKHQ